MIQGNACCEILFYFCCEILKLCVVTPPGDKRVLKAGPYRSVTSGTSLALSPLMAP